LEGEKMKIKEKERMIVLWVLLVGKNGSIIEMMEGI